MSPGGTELGNFQVKKTKNCSLLWRHKYFGVEEGGLVYEVPPVKLNGLWWCVRL